MGIDTRDVGSDAEHGPGVDPGRQAHHPTAAQACCTGLYGDHKVLSSHRCGADERCGHNNNDSHKGAREICHTLRISGIDKETQGGWGGGGCAGLLEGLAEPSWGPDLSERKGFFLKNQMR